MDIPFDKKYAEAHMQQLQKFYFLHMLPALVDDFTDKKINLCKNYLQHRLQNIFTVYTRGFQPVGAPAPVKGGASFS